MALSYQVKANNEKIQNVAKNKGFFYNSYTMNFKHGLFNSPLHTLNKLSVNFYSKELLQYLLIIDALRIKDCV